MADTNRRAGPSIAAGLLILGLTAGFVVIGVDLTRDAFDSSRVDRQTLLAAIGLGLNEEELQNLQGIAAGVVLLLSSLTLVLGVGVLARREGVRHAAIGTFVVFAAITILLAVAGLFSEDPPRGVLVGLAIGLLDAAVVVLLLRRDTVVDFERAEMRRQRERAARRAERAARRASRAA